MDGAPRWGSEERQLARLVSDAVDYAIFLLDPEGNILSWNAGAERMMGYTRDEVVGRPFSIFHTDEDLARSHPGRELAIALRDGRYAEEGWRVRKDGTRLRANVVLTPIRDEAGTLIGFGKISRDVTARRASEDHMRATARELEGANRELSEYRRLVSSVRDYAIFMLDPSGLILSWNTGARRLKGYAADEVLGRHFSIFYTDGDRARGHPADELDITVREGRYEEEGWRVRKDGTLFWATVTITAIHDDDGRLTGFAKVTRDLTERKAAEEALRDAIVELQAANAELDRFATVAAHDMTDPLRTISGFAELLERTERPRQEVQQYAGHIHASSARLTGMLHGLLTYARAGKSEEPPEPVDLARATEHVLADLAGLVADRSATVEIDVPAHAAISAKPHDVQLVLQNLISNAIKFGDPEHPAVQIQAEPTNAGDWRVTVRDNGEGIDPTFHQRIFDAFQRAHASVDRAGYGLGLAICQRLVDRHGGSIGVDSQPGQGSCFWFVLPGVTPEGGEAGEAPAAGP